MIATLREQLEARYRALAELDEDLAVGKLSRVDHASLKAEQEREAAALLSRIEQLERAPTEPAPGRKPAAPTAPESRRPHLQRPLVLASGAALFLLLGLALGVLLPRLVTSQSRPSSSASSEDRLARLQQELQVTPNDVSKLLAFGHLALDEGRPAEAIRVYRQVLSLEPNSVEAITHTGILLFQGGHVDQALSHLDRALALDPSYAHALWDKANILYHARKDYAGAIKAWEAFLVLISSGEDADRARAMIVEAKGRALLPKPGGPAGKP